MIAMQDIDYPVVVVREDKHDTEYRIAKSEKGLKAICLRILRENLACTYYYEPTAPTVILPTYEQIAALPEAYQKNVISDRAADLRRLKAYDKDLVEWNQIRKALDEQDGALAYQILKKRANYEYEGFRVLEVDVYE